MTNPNLTEIVFIIDESGSMQPLTSDTIGGFNTLLQEHKDADGECHVTLTFFATDVRHVMDGANIQNVDELSEKVYKAAGSTSLCDAIGKTCERVGKRLAKTPEHERPSKVLVCIITDGEENSSRLYNNETIKEMVEEQRGTYNWEFMYLGANIDEFDVANKYGMDISTVSSWTPDKEGARGMMRSATLSSTRYRKTGDASVDKEEST